MSWHLPFSHALKGIRWKHPVIHFNSTPFPTVHIQRKRYKGPETEMQDKKKILLVIYGFREADGEKRQNEIKPTAL